MFLVIENLAVAIGEIFHVEAEAFKTRRVRDRVIPLAVSNVGLVSWVRCIISTRSRVGCEC